MGNEEMGNRVFLCSAFLSYWLYWWQVRASEAVSEGHKANAWSKRGI